MNSALSMQDLYVYAQMYYFAGGIILWEGQSTRSLCREEKHLFPAVESKGIMISIAFTLFYLSHAPCCLHKGQRALLQVFSILAVVQLQRYEGSGKHTLRKWAGRNAYYLGRAAKNWRHLLWRHTTVLFSSCCIEAKDLHLAFSSTHIWQRKSVLSGNANR